MPVVEGVTPRELVVVLQERLVAALANEDVERVWELVMDQPPEAFEAEFPETLLEKDTDYFRRVVEKVNPDVIALAESAVEAVVDEAAEEWDNLCEVAIVPYLVCWLYHALAP